MSRVQFVIWKDSFSVGLDRLDAQHKRIFNIINKLYNSMLEKGQSSILDKTLSDLAEYTQTHLTDEEYLLWKCGYPEYESHKKAHDYLRQKTRDIVEEQSRVLGDISPDVLKFLKAWWKGHILTMDQKYSSCLSKLPNKKL